MTEIPVFPPGMAPEQIAEPGQGEEWWRPLHRAITGIGPTFARNRMAERLEAAQNIYPVTIDPVPIVLSGGNGVLDLPQLFGPTLGHFWDVHLISATGYTAGLVQGWKNLPAIATGGTTSQGALRAPFASAGVLTFGKNHCPLRHGEHLVFVATGITVPAGGQVLVSLEATGMTDPYVGEYLR